MPGSFTGSTSYGTPPKGHSMQTPGSGTRGNRAPAPAALDLSPRTETSVRGGTGGDENGTARTIGFGLTSIFSGRGRRVVTDSAIDNVRLHLILNDYH